MTTIASDWNDIGAVVDHLLALRHVSQVSIVGWSLGGPRTGGYAGQNPDKVGKLVLLAPAYVREASAKPPAQVPAAGAAMNTQSHDEFTAQWNRQVGCPGQVDPGVSDAAWSDMLLSDPVGATWGSGVRRAPQVTNWGWNSAMAAGTRIPTLMITGEHGTGKEVVAQMLHGLSARASRSLVAVNTGALPEGTFESELFGHIKGAFTDARTDRIGRFELADGGTLFLDEIANVPLRQQAKLLRVLETGEMERVGSSKTRRVNVRVLSATNADVHAEAEAGRFRSDLLFRLNTVEIHLPPLRDRREDIPALAAHFLSRYAARYRKQIQGFEPAALQAMLGYPWPGNVRELDHTIERAVLMAATARIALADLGLSTPRISTASLEEMSLEAVESILIRKALARCNGNVSQAAEALGLSRGALYRRMEKYGL